MEAFPKFLVSLAAIAALCVVLVAGATFCVALWPIYPASKYIAFGVGLAVVTYALWSVWVWRGASNGELDRIRRRAHLGLGWCLLFIAAFLSLGYLARPSSESQEDEFDEISEAVIAKIIIALGSNELHGDIYIRIGEDRDPSGSLWAKLTSHKWKRQLALWSSRPSENFECSKIGSELASSCNHDFVAIASVSHPFSHVASVRVVTLACIWRVALIKGSNDWHVIGSGIELCV